MRPHLPTSSFRRSFWRSAGRTEASDVRYRYKKAWGWPGREARVVGKLRESGWEFVDLKRTGMLTQLRFRRVAPRSLLGWLTPRVWLSVLLVCALLAGLSVAAVKVVPQWNVRYEAWAAVRSLESGDLGALEERLADNRGDPDFAYYFTSEVTPRDLGDALATVAGSDKDEPLKAGIDPHWYELTLTDLAGVLALATHGSGDRALPKKWTSDFITATTKPSALYKVEGSLRDKIPFHKTEAEKRRDQDAANRSNLLHLLARGYWSSGFLRSVTREYYDFDREEGEDAWPDADPGDDVGYAPAPNGAYLTDGVLALTAALTANSAASEWAFTEFEPGTLEVDGSDESIGKFTHFLLFEHEFPEGSDGESIGVTAALTALSSAIDSASSQEVGFETVEAEASSQDVGPLHDSEVLQALARDVANGSDCSLNPLDYGDCVVDAAKAVWGWVRRWGHLVLDILTLATFAPPPFNAVGAGAAATNATWYAVEGDFGMAGLSLAAAVPGLAFGKIARGANAAKDAATVAKAEKAAAKTDGVAKAAKGWRPFATKPWKDCDLVPPGGLRLSYGTTWTRAQRNAADEKVKAYYELAQQGKLVKTVSQRSGTTATSRYQKATGKDVRVGQDVDHIQDLQLGGTDDISNLRPLDKVVNASLGQQVAVRIRDLDEGELLTGAAIC